jgi:hypothetical protein
VTGTATVSGTLNGTSISGGSNPTVSFTPGAVSASQTTISS